MLYVGLRFGISREVEARGLCTAKVGWGLLGQATTSSRGAKGDELGLDILNQNAKSLKKIVAKALNKNQLLLLNKIKTNSHFTITTLIDKISREDKIPTSTLKLNSKVLKDLDLIEFGNSRKTKLTESGSLVLKLLGCEI